MSFDPGDFRPARTRKLRNRQVALSTVMLVVALVGVYPACLRYRSGPLTTVILLSPYVVLLFVLYRLIRGPFALAAVFFASHAIACIASAILVVQTTDGVAR
jgi:hypothetical protein